MLSAQFAHFCLDQIHATSFLLHWRPFLGATYLKRLWPAIPPNFAHSAASVNFARWNDHRPLGIITTNWPPQTRQSATIIFANKFLSLSDPQLSISSKPFNVIPFNEHADSKGILAARVWKHKMSLYLSRYADRYGGPPRLPSTHVAQSWRMQ